MDTVPNPAKPPATPLSVPSRPPARSETVGPIPRAATRLNNTAIGIAEKIIEFAQQIPHNKCRCAFLASSVTSVAEELRRHQKEELDDRVGQQLQGLIQHLNEVKGYVRELQSWGLLRRIIMRDRVSEDLEEREKKLDAFRLIFLPPTPVDKVERSKQDKEAADRNKQAKDEAQRAKDIDRAALLADIRHLIENESKLADAIGIRGTTFSTDGLSELDALRQEILADGNVDPAIKAFVTAAADMLFRCTGTRLERRQPWYVSPKTFNIHHDESLGSGAYGEVFKATMDGTIVAVKLFKNHQSLESKLQEIAVWRNLSHSHVLKFLGANIFSKPPFAISPYCANGNALMYLQSPGRVADKVCLLRDVAAGMEYLHSGQIIHGDLKASNVLIDSDGRAVVGDFGLSGLKVGFLGGGVSEGESEIHVPTTGSILWQPPEAWRNVPPSSHSDIYAFAMTALEILGSPERITPFSDISLDQLGQKLQNGERPERPEQARGFDSADAVWDIVEACWSQDVDDRPPFSQTSVLLGFLQESRPEVRMDLPKVLASLEGMSFSLWPRIVDYACLVSKRGGDAWLDAAPVQSQESAVDDLSVSLHVLAIAAATSRSQRNDVRKSVDFVQLRRILLAESAPDKVRANVFQLIVNLATDVEEWWPGMDMQKTEPEAVDSGTWSASIALLKPKTEIGKQVLSIFLDFTREIWTYRSFRSYRWNAHDVTETTSQALIDVGILDHLAAFIDADEDHETIESACTIAVGLIRRGNWQSGELALKVLENALKLLIHPSQKVRDQAAGLLSVPQPGCQCPTCTERRKTLGELIYNVLFNREFGCVRLFKDGDVVRNIAILQLISPVLLWAPPTEETEVVRRESLLYLSVLLGSEDEDTQTSAVQSLSILGLVDDETVCTAIASSGCAAKLHALLSSPDAAVQVRVCKMLVWNMFDEDGVDIMSILVKSENEEVKAAAWRSLERTFEQEDKPLRRSLKAALAKKNILALAVEALDYTEDFLNDYVQVVTDWDDLASYGGHLRIPSGQVQIIALRKLVSKLEADNDLKMREECVRPEILDPLLCILKGDDGGVIDTAMDMVALLVYHRHRPCLHVIGALVQAGCAPPLIGLLENDDDDVVRNAYKTLACMAMGSYEDVDALRADDAFTQLLKKISALDDSACDFAVRTFKATSAQVMRLIKHEHKESRTLGTTLLRCLIQSRDSALLNTCVGWQDELDRIAESWAESPDADVRALADDLKGALRLL